MKLKLLILFLFFPLVVGCSNTVENGKPETVNMEATHIIISTSAYYTSSPAQGRPADGRLEAGTKVQLISGAGSYMLVKTSSGISAYISSAVLKPLSK